MKAVLASVLLASAALALPAPGNKVTVRSRPLRRQNQIIPVVVGGQQVTFVPNSVVAAVGDVIQFQFSNGNHTVTQSTATEGCKPMAGGVHSGHIPFADGQTDVGTFNMVVANTEPMFLYCATGPHCQLGQVMIVNPTNAAQVANYAKLSQATKESVDGGAATGGTVGKITLANAAFIPAPPEDPAAAGGAPPPAEPPAKANGTEAAAPPAASKPAAEAPAAEKPAGSKPAAEAPAAANVPAVLVGLGLGR